MVARPCAGVGEAEFLRKLADVALVEHDAEAIGADPHEAATAPAYDAVRLPIGAGFDAGEF